MDSRYFRFAFILQNGMRFMMKFFTPIFAVHSRRPWIYRTCRPLRGGSSRSRLCTCRRRAHPPRKSIELAYRISPSTSPVDLAGRSRGSNCIACAQFVSKPISRLNLQRDGFTPSRAHRATFEFYWTRVAANFTRRRGTTDAVERALNRHFDRSD